jgi:hypothetical protein
MPSQLDAQGEAFDVPFGDNFGPPLDDVFDAFAESVNKYVATGNRWIEERPDIEDEDTAQKAAVYLKQVGDLKKEIEAERKVRNKPHQDVVKDNNKRFAELVEPLEIAASSLKKTLDKYLHKKDEEAQAARRAAEAEARQKEEAARRAAEEAAKAETNTIEARVAAEKAEREADAAAKAAKKASAPARVQTDYGQTASITRRWVGRITSRDDLDLEMLRPHLDDAALEKALRSFVRAGGRAIGGAVIEQVTSTSVR